MTKAEKKAAVLQAEHDLLAGLDVEVRLGTNAEWTVQYTMGVIAMTDEVLRLIEDSTDE